MNQYTLKKRDEILQILEEFRESNMGNLGIANRIWHLFDGHINLFTVDPLCILLVNDEKENLYEKVGVLDENEDEKNGGLKTDMFKQVRF